MTTGGVLSEKDHPRQSQMTDAEISAVVEEAHRVGIPVASHAQGTPGVKNALRNGVDTVEHGIWLDDEAVDLFHETGATLVPTLAVMHRICERGAEHGLPEYGLEKAYEAREAHFESARKAHEAGVPVALGTDFLGPELLPHGENALEAELFVEEVGMSEREAIRAGTDDYLTKREMDAQALENTVRRALERAQKRMGLHLDRLTGLHNREAFHARLTEELNRCHRYGTRFALMLVDLNGFKAVNDDLGHLAGDDLLRQFGRHLRAGLRESDFIARYGGDELCVIAPQTPASEAQGLARRFREELAATTFRCGGEDHPVRIGCSIGITEVGPESGQDPDALLQRVDNAMYAAKREGAGVRIHPADT